MNNVILAIAVATAFFASFIYGVNFGRKIEVDAQMNACKSVITSHGSTYSPGYSSDSYQGGGTYDYTPSK